MELLKLHSKGEDVKKVQEYLGLVADGDFGPKTEAAVKAWQKENGLIADGVIGEKSWALMFPTKSDDLQIVERFLPTGKGMHMTYSPNRKIKYLVIHYTAGSSSEAGNAEVLRKGWLTRAASADFVVDDETIIQANPDPKNYFCWAVGDGKGKYGIYNKDCISIEICSSRLKGTDYTKPNHEGWYFTDEVVNNAVNLSKYLMNKYNIDIDHVIRHYDASHKLCPGIIGWNPGSIYTVGGAKTINKSNEDKWIKFKNRLKLS